jgi:hypothetical protein
MVGVGGVLQQARRPCGVRGVTLALIALAGPVGRAQAQSVERDKQAATEAFRLCREMERDGDATACWRLWLRKYRTLGHEAEVMVAEERVAAKEDPTPEPRQKEPPPARTETTEEESREPPGTSREPPAGPPAGPTAMGVVLDLCALKPRDDAARFVKARVVLLALSGVSRLDGDPAIRQVEGARLVREVFRARFPLERFYNVVADLEGSKGWQKREALSVSTVREHLRAVPKVASDDDDDEKERGPDEASFVAYSVACADYLVVPAPVGHEVEWRDVEVTTKRGGKQKVKQLNLKLEAEVAIFKREGTELRRLALLSARVPGALDFATDLAAGAMVGMDVPGVEQALAVERALELPKHMSALPSADCVFDLVGIDGQPGLQKCAKSGPGDGAVASSLAQADEALGPTCRAAYRGEGAPAEVARSMVACAVRTRAFQLARALQTDARSVPGWRLFAPLQLGTKDEPEAHAVSLGREEGLKVGYAFQRMGARGERLAFFKVTDVGPGGECGTDEPSELALRMGDGEAGTGIEEYPLVGITLLPYATIAGLTYNYEATVFQGTGGATVYELPVAVFGGGVHVSWDMSPVIGVVESHLRVAVSGLFGGGTRTTLLLVPIDVSFEKGFYLGGPVTFFAGLGGSATYASLEAASSDAGAPEQSLSAWVFGMNVRTGLDFLLHPTTSLRVEFATRVHFNRADYTDDDGNAPQAGFERRDDHFATLGGSLGFHFML